MHEMITVKKQDITWLHVLISGILSVGFFFGDMEAIKYYLKERYWNRLSSGKDALWFFLCVLLTFLAMEAISCFSEYLIKLISDRETYVAVRKSSMENKRAAEIYERFRKRTRRIRAVNTALMDSAVALIVIGFARNKEYNGTVVILCVFIVIILFSINPVYRNALKKEAAQIDNLTLQDCDMALAFDVMEHSRLIHSIKAIKERKALAQASYCYLMNDLPETSRKLNCCGRLLGGELRIMYIYLKAVYALDTGDRQGFYAATGELNAFEQKRKLTPKEAKKAAEVRREWDIRVGLIEGDPFNLIPMLIQILPTETNKASWMDRTFQLAWLQLKVGNKEEARRNLQIVAEGAGTMAIRRKAAELLARM